MIFLLWMLPVAAAITSLTENCLQKSNTTVDEMSRLAMSTYMYDMSNCLYFSLLENEFKSTGDITTLHSTPPPDKEINIRVENVVVHHVELARDSQYQFSIDGYIYVTWEDTRLKWDADNWKMDVLTLHEGHKIWQPKLADHSICGDAQSCESSFQDMDILSDGRVYATFVFKYLSYCAVNFKRYPEEQNSCCTFFAAFEPEKSIHYQIETDEEKKVERPVVVSSTMNRDSSFFTLSGDHSAWTVTKRQVSVAQLLASQQLLKVCIEAEKRMPTLRTALYLPVFIATVFMLLSPLFGDLRTQAAFKMAILFLQTVCFLYLCSLAPANGFAGDKPKIYSFYECIFVLTTLSVIVTMCCLALSRMHRSVPPTHKVYLFAKLVNRLICCIEPEQSASYMRHIDNAPQQQEGTDYTQDWRHVYIAVNNLFSGLALSVFLLISLLTVF